MKRREFITLLGGAAAWPLTARAQQSERMRRIVFLHGIAQHDPEAKGPCRGLPGRILEALGWRTATFKSRTGIQAAISLEIQTYTKELVDLSPDLIVASSSPVIAALKQATSTIPIVFSVVNDPRTRLYREPGAAGGGNITGFTFVEFAMIGKWLELLNKIAPGVKRIRLLFNPERPLRITLSFLANSERTLHRLLRKNLCNTGARRSRNRSGRSAALAREPGGGLIAAPVLFLNAHRGIVIQLSERHRLPAIFGFRRYVMEGALISYGPDAVDVVRRSVGICRSHPQRRKPADLPVQVHQVRIGNQPQTAKALGLEVPQTLLARADEVIE